MSVSGGLDNKKIEKVDGLLGGRVLVSAGGGKGGCWRGGNGKERWEWPRPGLRREPPKRVWCA